VGQVKDLVEENVLALKVDRQSWHFGEAAEYEHFGSLIRCREQWKG
jgi:hypothetical protein